MSLQVQGALKRFEVLRNMCYAPCMNANKLRIPLDIAKTALSVVLMGAR